MLMRSPSCPGPAPAAGVHPPMPAHARREGACRRGLAPRSSSTMLKHDALDGCQKAVKRKWRQVRGHLVDGFESIVNASKSARKLGSVNVDGFEAADADHLMMSGKPAVSSSRLSCARDARDINKRCQLSLVKKGRPKPPYEFVTQARGNRPSTRAGLRSFELIREASFCVI
jgi:hypothetical protein